MTHKDWNVASNAFDVRHEKFSAEGEIGRRCIEKCGIEWFFDVMGKDENDEYIPCSVLEFEQTPRIPSYLMAVCAGPYEIIEY